MVFFKPTKSFMYKFTSPFAPFRREDIYAEQYYGVPAKVVIVF